MVWSTPLGLPRRCGIGLHQHSTSGIRRKRRRRHSTYWHRVWSRVWVDIFGGLHYWQIRDTREENVTIRSEIWSTNIRSLGFQDIREWVILWRLMLPSLGLLILCWVILTKMNSFYFTWIVASHCMGLVYSPATPNGLAGWAFVPLVVAGLLLTLNTIFF